MVELVEVDQFLERAAQRVDLVIAGGVGAQLRVRAEEGHRVGIEEGRHAAGHRRCKLRVAAAIQFGRPPGTKWSFCDARPEVAQLVDPLAGLAAGDQRGVDRADRGADDPVGRDAGLVQRLIDADLIGAERAAALEDEDGLAERGDFLGERFGHGFAFQAALRAAASGECAVVIAGDQAGAALEGEVVPQPAEADREPAAKADQEPDVGEATRSARRGSR